MNQTKDNFYIISSFLFDMLYYFRHLLPRNFNFFFHITYFIPYVPFLSLPSYLKKSPHLLHVLVTNCFLSCFPSSCFLSLSGLCPLSLFTHCTRRPHLCNSNLSSIFHLGCRPSCMFFSTDFQQEVCVN